MLGELGNGIALVHQRLGDGMLASTSTSRPTMSTPK